VNTLYKVFFSITTKNYPNITNCFISLQHKKTVSHKMNERKQSDRIYLQTLISTTSCFGRKKKQLREFKTSMAPNKSSADPPESWPRWSKDVVVLGILNVVLHMYQRYLNGRIEETKTSFHLDPLEFQAMTVANGCFSAGSNNSLQTSTTLPEAI